MRDPLRFRELARHCRSLLSSAGNPELASQLQQWAVECDRRADTAEHKRPQEKARGYRMRAEEYRTTAEQMRAPLAQASFRQMAETYEAMARGLEHVAHRIHERRDKTG
jgi:hypothetical protein